MVLCDLYTHVHDPARLAALRAVALLDTPTEESFDRLTWLATRVLHAPVALVSLVDEERQFFKSVIGLPEPWLSRRETPLSHSFCQHNRIAATPLVIPDALKDPVFKDNPAIQDLGVTAYLGMPLVTPDGYVLGSFCVIDSKPRQWTEDEIDVVRKLAHAVMTEIHLRTEIATGQQAEEKLKGQNEELREAYRHLETETADRVRAVDELRRRDQILIQQSRLASMGEMISNIAHHWRQPLNTLALLVQELPVAEQRGELTRDYLTGTVAQMMKSIREMSGTIDDFMSFFKPDRSKVNFSVPEAVQKSLSLLDDSLKEAGITVEVKTAATPVIKGYANEYAQAILNVITNARDALIKKRIPSPRITIDIGTEGDHSVVDVSDNAGGIPADIIEKIFDPYFSTKGPTTGAGIGLYMSKMIIENNMGGALSVRNVNGGARFTVVV